MSIYMDYSGCTPPTQEVLDFDERLENRCGFWFHSPNYIYTAPNGLKIGFFGMETPETQTKVNPALITEITFFMISWTCQLQLRIFIQVTF